LKLAQSLFRGGAAISCNRFVGALLVSLINDR